MKKEHNHKNIDSLLHGGKNRTRVPCHVLARGNGTTATLGINIQDKASRFFKVGE